MEAFTYRGGELFAEGVALSVGVSGITIEME